jgi:predicted dinucleotide-binding enzyme
MKIAVIGAGAVGAALGEGWARAGHKIIFGARNIGNEKTIALARRIRAEVAPLRVAAASAEVIALATPWSAALEAVQALGDVAGKIIIDATNPVRFADGVLSLVHQDGLSAGEQIAAAAKGAAVVKTLNQVGAEMMAAEKNMAAKPSMFVAGEDERARATACSLVADLGFEAFDAGGIRQARHLEHFAMVWINQAMFRGAGRNWAFGVLRQQTKS